MGLFHQNFDKPGPGISPNAPRKKGAARYFEVLARDFSTFWMAGLLAMISSLPFALGLWFAVTTHSLIPMLLAGILGGMLAAPQIVGLNDTVLRALRDEPGYWWVTYRRAWKRNAKASLLPGAICGLLLAMDVVIEDRDGSQDHRQDNDDDAVAEDRLVRALAGIVVFVFGLVVTLIVLFHGANILYKYNKRRGNRCRFVSENRRTSPHVLQI